MRKASVVLLIMSVPFVACAGRTRTPETSITEISESRLVRQSYMSSKGEPKEFFVYLPRGYDSESERRWPVMLFLHGDGERGNSREDLDWVLVHGPLYEAWVQKRDLPFLIVAPQLPLYGRIESQRIFRNVSQSVCRRGPRSFRLPGRWWLYPRPRSCQSVPRVCRMDGPAWSRTC
jgi:hypothetical protein